MEYMEQAMAMVQAQAGVKPMTPAEMVAEVAEVAKGLAALAAGECATETVEQEPAVDPKKSIKAQSVTCIECGKKYKVLTKKHLATHDLTPEERSGSKKLDHSLRWTYDSRRRLFDVQQEKKIYS